MAPTNIINEEELATVLNKNDLPGPFILPIHVDAESERRMNAGFSFGGYTFQSDVESQKRINGATTMALLAVMGGKQPGDFRWNGGDQDFYWIAADNSQVPMDAQTVVKFGKACGLWVTGHIYAARQLKDAVPIPQDFADDAYWPKRG
jgi:hypothetical protein